jgi:UPF0755 protein
MEFNKPQESIMHTRFGSVSRRFHRRILTIGSILLALIGGGVIALSGWYAQSLSSVDKGKSQTILFEVKQGDSVATIAQNLQSKGIIRSGQAFQWHVKRSGVAGSLQAGSYALQTTMSVPQIVDHLKSGKTDTFALTILPGKTLKELTSDLKNYGYDGAEISAALKKSYSAPILADKPSRQGIEGYLFPETFQASSSDALDVIFARDLNFFSEKVAKDGLPAKLRERGLNLHEAITLASIIQKEVSDPSVQPQVAQVFLKRLSMGMKLESDVTFHYAAKQRGVTPDLSIDSPYNTRKYGGLPPGPIANFNYTALQAVAFPARGDYLYFVAGDDGQTYFANTLDQHEQNIAKYCKKLCGKQY